MGELHLDSVRIDEVERAPGETTEVLTLGGIRHQDICAEHVAIETNAAIKLATEIPK